MNNELNESLIFWENSKYLGVDFLDLYKQSAKKIADELLNDFSKDSNFGIICGLGGNAADGFAVAIELVDQVVNPVNIYLVGRPQNFTNPIADLLWDELYTKSKNNKKINIIQDCFAKDIAKSDVVIECLVGTGIQGAKLNKRFLDVIKRVSHFEAKIIAIDIACPNYTPDLTYSIIYPKSSNAKTIEIDIPTELELFCGPGEKNLLLKPKKFSHKNKNGSVLYISHNNEFDSIVESELTNYLTKFNAFHFSSNENFAQDADNLDSLISEVNVILLGNINQNLITTAAINFILDKFPEKIFILFGSVLNIIDIEKIGNRKNILIIMDRMTIPEVFKNKMNTSIPIEGKLKRFSIENGIYAILFGTQIYIYSVDGSMKMIRNLNISGADNTLRIISKISAYSAVNDLWLSMRAAMAKE